MFTFAPLSSNGSHTIMVRHVYLTAEHAHMLTKDSKKNGYYFRTLSRTDTGSLVHCETNCRKYPWK